MLFMNEMDKTMYPTQVTINMYINTQLNVSRFNIYNVQNRRNRHMHTWCNQLHRSLNSTMYYVPYQHEH